MSDPPAPAGAPRSGWTGLVIALMIAACLVAAVATAIYLNGAYLQP